MSRDLPSKPNLEHLRNQARDLLHELRQKAPDARLADAQYSLARSYRFASWPRLKAHVEALGTRPTAAVRENRLGGKWIADVSRSSRHPANLFRRATVEIAVEGDTLTFVDETEDEHGRVHTGRNVVVADGRDRAAANGYSLLARWSGSRRLETIAKKDGEVVGGGAYEVSPDGPTLTFRDRGTEYVVVFDRR